MFVFYNLFIRSVEIFLETDPNKPFLLNIRKVQYIYAPIPVTH